MQIIALLSARALATHIHDRDTLSFFFIWFDACLTTNGLVYNLTLSLLFDLFHNLFDLFWFFALPK